MSKEAVKSHLAMYGFEGNILEFDEDATATVELAAQAIGCETGRIAKTMSLMTKAGAIVIVLMGDAKLDNRKYKDTFLEKSRFLRGEEVMEHTGHPIGGVCPFALKEGCRVYLDESLKKYEYVYPAAGAPNNSVRLTLAELELATGGSWVDIAKIPE